MSKKIIKMGIVGCGRVAQHYKKIFKNNLVKNLSLVACCDIDNKKANELARTFSAKSYTDFNIMFSENDLDIVAILTESGNHYEHIKLALKKGFHVIAEKPITLIPEQAYELEYFAKKENLYLEAVFQNRFNPSIIKLKKTLDEGRFGKIISASVRLRWCRYQDYYEDGWHGTWAMDGGVINQQAIHHIDALNWLCGPVNCVVAKSANRLNNLEAEDTMVASIKFDSGALGTIEATTAARPEDFEASLSIVGEGGMVVIGGVALNQIEIWNFVEPVPEDEEVILNYSQEVPSGYGLGHIPLLQELVSRLQNSNINPILSASEAVKAIELVHALYSSIEKNSWVNLYDKPRSEKLGKNY
jgi:UDP-N-acetyl-2-amino-2-deoxyglucuronate dehydrogenase